MEHKREGLIGGHRGLDVVRAGNLIYKIAQTRDGEDLYLQNAIAIHNEAKFLEAMIGSGVTPALVEEGEGYSVQEDVGDPDFMENGEVWRRHCMKALWEIRQRNIRHGDLTGPGNVMCIQDYAVIVDWQEAHYIGEKAPQKQPFSDSYLMWRTIAGTMKGGDGAFDTPRVARRWLAVMGSLGASTHLELPLKDQTFVDLGCFQGDFVAAAAIEGMMAMGIDQGGFRTGGDSIAEGRQIFGYMGEQFRLTKANIVDWVNLDMGDVDVAIMFSTWSYIVRDYGIDRAIEVLEQVILQSNVFFFENQLYGDGPGPELFQSDDDIQALLELHGNVKKLVTIPVSGRPASRTVWKVTH